MGKSIYDTDWYSVATCCSQATHYCSTYRAQGIWEFIKWYLQWLRSSLLSKYLGWRKWPTVHGWRLETSLKSGMHSICQILLSPQDQKKSLGLNWNQFSICTPWIAVAFRLSGDRAASWFSMSFCLDKSATLVNGCSTTLWFLGLGRAGMILKKIKDWNSYVPDLTKLAFSSKISN